MKREILLYALFYSDAVYLANTLYRPAIDVSQKIPTQEDWENEELIRVECNDCVYYIAKNI